MVYLNPAIRVEIQDDQSLVSSFLKWQIEKEIYAFRGGSSGLGDLVQWFPAEFKTELEEFFDGSGTQEEQN